MALTAFDACEQVLGGVRSGASPPRGRMHSARMRARTMTAAPPCQVECDDGTFTVFTAGFAQGASASARDGSTVAVGVRVSRCVRGASCDVPVFR